MRRKESENPLMSNYISDKIVCTPEILNKYFIDYHPFNDDPKVEHPYITFNKLFGVNDLGEYTKNYGTAISYGYGFYWRIRADAKAEILFQTRWEYPISAIVRSLELFKENVIWYAVDEGSDYVSKFYVENGIIKEDVCSLDDEYWDWWEAHEYLFDELNDADDMIWYYLNIIDPEWKTWHTNDFLSLYLNNPIYKIDKNNFPL
ncbi:MAG: hypothetical protein IJL89_11250 [Firmicutes bacterium]|nr:hypothetical protein [Bacillota bacterium]